MDALGIETMSMRPVEGPTKERQRAADVAGQFESVFVRTLVSSLRQTASIGDGGIFGDGPGADTYGDWFDQNLAEQIGRSGHIGIAEALMADFARSGAIAPDEAAAGARTAAAAVDRGVFTSLTASSRLGGGIDVVR